MKEKIKALLRFLGYWLYGHIYLLAYLGRAFGLWLVQRGHQLGTWLWKQLMRFWSWWNQKYSLQTRVMVYVLLGWALSSIGLIRYIYLHSKVQQVTSGPASHHDMEWISESPLEGDNKARHLSIYQDRYRQVICYVMDTQMSCVNNIFALEEKRLEQSKVLKTEPPKPLTSIQKSTDTVEMYNYTKDENERFKPNPVFKEREQAEDDYEKLEKPPGEASPAKKTSAWKKAYQRNR